MLSTTAPADTATAHLKLAGKREVADYAGVSRRTIDFWLQQGLPHLRISARILRFDLPQVDRWLKEKYKTARFGKLNA